MTEVKFLWYVLEIASGRDTAQDYQKQTGPTLPVNGERGQVKRVESSRNEGWWSVDGIGGEQFRDLFDSSQGFALSVLWGGEASGEKSYGLCCGARRLWGKMSEYVADYGAWMICRVWI